jgi:hypothetical protein
MGLGSSTDPVRFIANPSSDEPSASSRIMIWGRTACVLWLVSACAPVPEENGRIAATVVYDVDDRRELYQAGPGLRMLAIESSVALVPRDLVRLSGRRGVPMTRTLGESANLCPGERFEAQPSLALCSGVLLDWDLVLTAGHCLRQLPPQDLLVVFDYALETSDQTATFDEATGVAEIVAEEVSGETDATRVDYAWLRLATPAYPPRRPAGLRASTATLVEGQKFSTLGHPYGVPLKLIDNANVVDGRAENGDYFIADADTSHGWSGGGAFDAGFTLLGILARGGPDFFTTDEGCAVTFTAPVEAAEEQFTYARRALEGLCRKAASTTSLCRSNCGDECETSTLPEPPESGGCQLGAGRPDHPLPELALFVSACFHSLRRRRAHLR